MQPDKIPAEDKVVALPGVTPSTFINHEAADILQGIVDKLRSGEVVGMAYVIVDSQGLSNYDWHSPDKMGNAVFCGASRLQHALMVSGTKWDKP